MTDWYVRPAGGSYGSEDGTSYADAWNGFVSIDWTASGVQPGDNLYVCGTHTGASQLTIGGSGVPGDVIVIRGDAQEESGLIETYEELHGSAWANEGGNVWSTTGQTATIRRLLLDEIGYSQAASAVAVDAADRWFLDTGTDVLYVYATQNPNNEYTSIKSFNWKSGYVSCISSDDREYYTIQNISLYGGGQNGIRARLSLSGTANLGGITIDNVRLRMQGKEGIVVYGQNTTYLINFPIVRNCDLDKQWFATEDQTDSPAGDGIRYVGNVQGGVIFNNRIVDYGHSAVSISSIASTVCSGHSVHGNRGYVVNSPYMRGFSLDPNGGTASVDDNFLYNNNFMGCNIRNQIAGQNNRVYCNLLQNNDSPVSVDDSDGLRLYTDADFGCVGNIVAANLITGCADEGLSISSSATDMGPNTIVNNIITGNGDGTHAQVLVYDEGLGAVRSTQIITNNVIWRSGQDFPITYEGADYSVAEADGVLSDFSNNAQTAVDPSLDASNAPHNRALIAAGVKVPGVDVGYDGVWFQPDPTIGPFEMFRRLMMVSAARGGQTVRRPRR